MTTQKEKATEFRKLHLQGDILVIANAWDAGSARIFEQAGFPALGTTSGGIAYSLGIPDGQKIARDDMLQAITRIAHRVNIPVTADIEAGYADKPSDLADTIIRLASTGAVGLNLEDSTKNPQNPLYELKTQLERITTVRKIADLVDIPLVINARCDVLLLGKGDKKTNLKETIRRGIEYRKAGADCFFPVGAIDAETISELVKGVGYPVNILANPNVPPVPELKRLGVRRVSVGSGPARATMGLIQRIAQELRTTGTYKTILEGTPSHNDANKLLS